MISDEPTSKQNVETIDQPEELQGRNIEIHQLGVDWNELTLKQNDEPTPETIEMNLG